MRLPPGFGYLGGCTEGRASVSGAISMHVQVARGSIVKPQHLAVLGWVLLLFACTGSPNQDAAGAVVRDSAGVRIVENHQATWDVPWRVSDEPSLTIGRTEGQEGDELYQVTGALRLGDGAVVVANSGTLELRLYDRDGTYVRSVGGRGGGPGEFQSLEWISRFASDSILALDVVGHRVSFFHSAGRFGRSVRLEPSPEILAPRPVGFFADGSFLATHGLYVLGAELPVRSERDEEGLFRFLADGNTVMRVGSFLGREQDIVVTPRPNGESAVERWPRLLGRATVYAAAGDRFYVADNETYEIGVYSIDPLQLALLIRKAHRHLEVTDADVRFVRDSLLASRSGAAQRMMRRSFENRPEAPQTMPAFAPEIRVDSHRCLWVREYTRPGGRRVTWSVFSEGGVLLGAVETPIGLRILDIGSDYVLGVVRDNDDVEYVQLHDLVRGS